MSGLGASTSRGFTLVEAVATMVILATVSTVLSGVVWAGVRSLDEGAESARLQSEASIAMERMVRDLRAIPLGGAGTPDISGITADSIVWDDATRRLELDGSNLVLTVGGQSAVLLADVTGFEVRAFDASNTALAETLSGSSVEPVRRLSLAVTVSRGRADATVRTKLFLRCMTTEGL